MVTILNLYGSKCCPDGPQKLFKTFFDFPKYRWPGRLVKFYSLFHRTSQRISLFWNFLHRRSLESGRIHSCGTPSLGPSQIQLLIGPCIGQLWCRRWTYLSSPWCLGCYRPQSLCWWTLLVPPGLGLEGWPHISFSLYLRLLFSSLHIRGRFF